jgi:hypothetical protein
MHLYITLISAIAFHYKVKILNIYAQLRAYTFALIHVTDMLIQWNTSVIFE